MVKKMCRIGSIVPAPSLLRDGVHELYDVLCEEITTNPASPKTKLFSPKLLFFSKIAISNTNYIIY